MKKAKMILLALLPFTCVCGCKGNSDGWKSDAKQIKVYANSNTADYFYANSDNELYYIRYDECCIKIKNKETERLYSHCTYVIEYKGE